MINENYFNDKVKSKGYELFEGKYVKNLYELDNQFFHS